MNHRALIWPLVLLICITLLGCEPVQPTANSGTAPPAPPGAPPPPPVPAETKVGAFAGGIDDLAARPAEPAPQPSPSPAEPATERVKAEAGVGAQGRSLDQYQGVVVTPIKAYFATRERIAFVASFQHQYDIYKAANDGAVPKDFADLKAKVLDPYQIKLPVLPQGQKYVWDAATEELQVERPKPQ